MINKYIKNPVEIEAIQWNGKNTEEVKNFVKDSVRTFNYEQNAISIETLEGTMKASLNDYIIKGIKGEFYPCKPDIFENSYTKTPTKLTNFDKLKRMTFDELNSSKVWSKYCEEMRKAGECCKHQNCDTCRKDWLNRYVD